MKYIHNIILFVFLACSISLIAQDYSYFSDKKFLSPSDLVGYNFVPSKLEIPNEREEDLSPDEYSFGITRSNLYVRGYEIEGVYNVNNINTTEYGFILKLISARDSRRQGHLKVILANKYYVDALVFKGSVNEPEMIFLMPSLSDEIRAADKVYFTDRTELELEEIDSIWGTTIYPFFKVYTQDGNIQERLYAADSLTVSFVEEIKLIEKTKKVKTEKKKEKKKKKEFNIELGEYEEEEIEEEYEEERIVDEERIEEEMNELEEGVDSTQVAESTVVQTKEIREYYIEVRSIVVNEDGSETNQLKRYTIKKLKERENEAAQGLQERFQIEIETNKGMVYLYLTGRRTISSVEFMNGDRFLMRGH